MTRQFWVIAHRWAGLTMALFLVVAGFTGAMLPFNRELTDLTAPYHRVAPPYPGAPLQDALALNQAALRAAPPGYRLEGLRLNIEADHVLELGVEPPAGSALPYLTVLMDPYTAKAVRVGEWGRISDGWDQIMPFLYRLHYKLAIDNYGLWAFGIAALIWTVDCFVGFYLTLPLRRADWWRRWGKAWRVRVPVTSGHKLNFDLHLASGLWLWPLLLVFAWSSVGMNLRQVYDPVMRGLGAAGPLDGLPDQPAPGFQPDWPRALAQGRQLAAQLQAERPAVRVEQEYSLFHDDTKNLYGYNFASTRDFTDKGGWSSIYYYPDGRRAQVVVATGGLGNGGADQWLMALHTAQVGGLAYRIAVSVVGVIVTLLTVTGVILWLKKRSARIARGTFRMAPLRQPAP